MACETFTTELSEACTFSECTCVTFGPLDPPAREWAEIDSWHNRQSRTFLHQDSSWLILSKAALKWQEAVRESSKSALSCQVGWELQREESEVWKWRKRKMSWIELDGLLQCTARASLILGFFPAWKKTSLPQLTQKTDPFPLIFALFLPSSKTSSYIESYCIDWSVYKAWKQNKSFFPFMSTWKIFADDISPAVCFSYHKLFIILDPLN